MRGAAGFHVGHGTEQVNCSVRVETMPLRQSSARRWREMSASRSEVGQLVGHANRGHSVAFLLRGFWPSIKRVESLELLTQVSLRALTGGFLSMSASMRTQSNGSIFPSEVLMESIEKISCLATQRTVGLRNG